MIIIIKSYFSKITTLFFEGLVQPVVYITEAAEVADYKMLIVACKVQDMAKPFEEGADSKLGNLLTARKRPFAEFLERLYPFSRS